MDEVNAKNLILVFLALIVAQVFVGSAYLFMEARNNG